MYALITRSSLCDNIDAWLEKQLASGASIGGDDDADVDVGDWEKELQNELKDYVEGS